MVLVTTALEETLPKKNKKILFLGQWCKSYVKKEVYKEYDYEILPYHWNDRRKLFEDTKNIYKIYEKYLLALSISLNNIHHVNFSISYWRIFIGPWLRWFIEISYDRYLSISKASKEKIDFSYIVDIKDEDMAPNNMSGFIKLFVTDAWNHFIYKEIIKFFNINTKTIKYEHKYFKNRPSSIKEKIKKIFFFLNKFNSIHLFSPYAKLNHTFRLQILMFQFPTLCKAVDIEFDTNYSYILRERLLLPDAKTVYEQILNTLIIKQIPKYYLEGYKKFQKKVLKTYPKKAKIIYTANLYSSNDAFKLWTAYKKESGSKYIIAQHGGGFGMLLFASHEDHQIKSADKFFSWGWDLSNNKKVIPTLANKLIKTVKYNSKGDILIVLMELPKYSFTLVATPIASQMLNYINEQIFYLKLISSSAKELLKLRLYMSDNGWKIKERVIDSGFGHLIDSRENLNKNFSQRLSECRLYIGTYNSTTYLETFAANFPTLLYWNPFYWELRDEAKPYFEMLKKVGILHYCPKSLATKVNEIYIDPLSWWNQVQIQEAKDKFCKRFANVEDNYILKFKNKLKDQI